LKRRDEWLELQSKALSAETISFSARGSKLPVSYIGNRPVMADDRARAARNAASHRGRGRHETANRVRACGRVLRYAVATARHDLAADLKDALGACEVAEISRP